MNMEEIYAQLDSLYGVDEGRGIEPFLTEKLTEAVNLADNGAIIQLLNELIGYYRETGANEQCVAYCVRLINIVENSEYKGTMTEATTRLNVANCLRAAGLLKESNEMYQQVKSFYDSSIPADSMLFASLFNNMSLLFQEMGDYESAADCLERALGISLNYDECYIEQATTYANLATTLIKLDRVDDAVKCLENSIELFERDLQPDYHYGAALSALAEIMYVNKKYEESARYYEKALAHIERNLGKTKAYELTLSNLNVVRNCMDVTKGLKLSKDYYEEFGIPMIHDLFPEYEGRIAVGLVGEGSECLGFDDDISKDHDFGPGFCMWLTDEDYNAIGDKLQQAYDALPQEYNGISRVDSGKAGKRVGVFRISDFYKKIMGIPSVPRGDGDWLFINDEQFLNATNGEVYRDDYGAFSEIRKVIADYYPKHIWGKKIARACAQMSQYGQYNYLRCLERDDKVTASIALGRFVEATMSMLYLIERQYAPYYKWMYRGLQNIEEYAEILELIRTISETEIGDAKIAGAVETICDRVRKKLIAKGLTDKSDNYLDNHVDTILRNTQ